MNRTQSHVFLTAILSLGLLTLARTSLLGQSNFVVTPNLALQVSFPSQESYRYQITASTNLTNWFPVTDSQVACGSTQTFTLGMTNGPHAFYRAEQFPPNLTNRIVGLSSIILDNAVFQAQDGTMSLSGFRVTSRDYTLDDYLKAQFQFDLAHQEFSLSNLQVFTNVGPVCGRSPIFFIKNVTNALSLLNGTNVLSPDTSLALTITGQVMSVTLQPGQVFGWVHSSTSVNYEATVTDPAGAVISTYIYSVNNWWWDDPINAIQGGTYTIRFVPQGASSGSLTLRFHNCNGHQTRVLTNGMHFSSSITDYLYDYDKFKVSLAAGQTLTMAGSLGAAYLQFFNSRGVPLGDGNTGGASWSLTAPYADTFYVIYYHYDTSSHSYSCTVSITP